MYVGVGVTQVVAMKIAWASDLHLDKLRQGAACRFGESVAKTGADTLLITGDLANAAEFSNSLIDIDRYFGGMIYFVLGNHDYWGLSWRKMHEKAARIGRHWPRMLWLTRAGVIRLSDTTALVGHDGWYDAQWGYTNPIRSTMNDWDLIKELKVFPTRTESTVWQSTLVRLFQERCVGLAREAEKPLRAALDAYPRVVFATHVPPYPQNAIYDGPDDKQPVDPYDRLPWYTNKAMGDLLLRLASGYPDRHITVLCGHAHQAHDHEILPNLRCRTAPAQYGVEPVIADVFEV